MKIKSLLYLLLVVFIACSCEFQPSEVYNRTVNRDVTAPQIQVVELNIDADTLYLYGSVNIKFKFKSNNQAIELVNFLIDGVDIGSVSSESGIFYLQCGEVKDGTHELKIEVYTASGTGSLAEELGAEAFVASQSWTLILDRSYVPAIWSTVENGLLHVKWTDYRASNLKEYVIHKGFSDQVTRRTKTSEFVDSSYVGEYTSYIVDVVTQDDIVYSVSYLYTVPDLPLISYSVEDSNRYLVKWTKSRYYNAVDTFSVYQGTEYDDNCSTHVKSTRDPNDTTYQVTSGCFGDLLNFKLKLVPRKTNADGSVSSYFFESHTFGILGFPFKTMDNTPYLMQVKQDEFVYYDFDSLKRYSVTEKRALEKLSYVPTGCYTTNFSNTQVSNTGRYLTSYVDCNSDLLFTKGTDLQQYSVHKLQKITGSFALNIAVSDAGTALIQNLDGGLNLYDLTTSAPLAYYKKNYTDDFARALKISPDGEYFFLLADTLRLVHFKDTLFTDVWKQPNPVNIKFFEFDPLHANQVIFWNGSKLSVNLCSDMSVVSEFPLNDAALLDIDYYNHEMLTCRNGHLLVRSFTDGSLIKDIPMNINPLSWPGAWQLIDHTLVYGRGLLYFIYPD
jgi:hypothetical protein